MTQFPTLPSSLVDHTGDVYAVIRAAQDTLMVHHIQRPKQPSLAAGVAAAKQYAIDLEIWEAANEAYKKEMTAIREHNGEVNVLIEGFIKKESGLFDIPEQYQNKVYYRAYSDGHSAGYYEVYQKLCELVEIFE